MAAKRPPAKGSAAPFDLMVDDLEAANETTVLLGQSLTRLQTSLDRLEERLSRVEAALGSSTTTGSV